MYSTAKHEKKKEFLFSVSDFELQMFSAGGHGGQGNQHCNTAARIIHHASGAQGVSRDERSGGQNRKLAFERCVKTKEFQTWLRVEVARHTGLQDEIKRKVEDSLRSNNLRFEIRVNNKWVEVDGDTITALSCLEEANEKQSTDGVRN